MKDADCGALEGIALRKRVLVCCRHGERRPAHSQGESVIWPCEAVYLFLVM
jgi:hypothetical protein